MPRKAERLPEELAQEVYLRLFPANTRRSLAVCLHTRWFGAPEWRYAIQEAGDFLVHLLDGIVAAYLYDYLRRRGTKREITIRDVFDRISHKDIVEYRYVLREVEERVRGDKSAPKYTFAVVERHQDIAKSLSKPAEAEEVLGSLVEQAARPPKRRPSPARVYRRPPT